MKDRLPTGGGGIWISYSAIAYAMYVLMSHKRSVWIIKYPTIAEYATTVTVGDIDMITRGIDR